MVPPTILPDPRVELAGRRTNFAIYRTALAIDRTTPAWIRTALTFETFGLGLIGFFRSINQAAHTERTERVHQFAIHVGVTMIVIGMVALLFSAASHARAAVGAAAAALGCDRFIRRAAVPVRVVVGAVLVSRAPWT